MKKILTTLFVSVSTAAAALAQTTITVNSGPTAAPASTLIALMQQAQTILNLAIPFLIGLGVAMLMFGVVMFMWKGRESEEEHAKWAKFMGMSVVGLFVMVSIWGLVYFIGGALGIGQGGSVPTPAIPVNPKVY